MCTGNSFFVELRFWLDEIENEICFHGSMFFIKVYEPFILE